MPKTNHTYQELSAELERVLAALQNPEVEIDEAITLYERGLKLVKQIDAQLKTAENKITQLKLQATESQE